MQEVATSGKRSYVAHDFFSLINGCTFGDYVLSQLVEALVLMPITNLNIDGELLGNLSIKPKLKD